MSPKHDTPPVFPLSAIQEQPALIQALLLAAIEPQLGGVRSRGPRGTAKSTAARALADLLAPAPFVTLPLGASEERIVGTLDLDTALGEGRAQFSPGLLAKANGGGAVTANCSQEMITLAEQLNAPVVSSPMMRINPNVLFFEIVVFEVMSSRPCPSGNKFCRKFLTDLGSSA